MPCVVVVPDDELLGKNISTIEQIKARGGPVIAVTNADLPDGSPTPSCASRGSSPSSTRSCSASPCSCSAYHAAAVLGRDIDKPRNLAKSVTVE